MQRRIKLLLQKIAFVTPAVKHLPAVTMYSPRIFPLFKYALQPEQ